MARKRRVPPSRARYEQRNPTVSIRVSREMYDRLKALKERSGKSFGDILREALGVQEPATKAAYTRDAGACRKDVMWRIYRKTVK